MVISWTEFYPNQIKKLESRGNISFTPHINYNFHSIDFNKIFNYIIISHGDIVYWTLPKLLKNIDCVGKYPFIASKCELSRNWCSDITLTAPISAKLTPAGQLFVKNSVTKFLENLTNGIVADKRQAADRWADIVSKNKVFFYFTRKDKIHNLQKKKTVWMENISSK